jgi:dipeptidyl aminopeptidase/acylaminoacyl peptidase
MCQLHRLLFMSVFMLTLTAARAQKKPLDHSVYDSWQSMGERKISHDGKWVAYVVDVQEGDGHLVVQRTDNGFTRTYGRGYNVSISDDSRFAIFRIKPPFADIRQARIKKTKPDEMPKDSLAILLLGSDSLVRIPRVKSYRMPEKGNGWLAVHFDKKPSDTAKAKAGSKLPDSSKAKFPAVVGQPTDPKNKRSVPGGSDDGLATGPFWDAEGDEPTGTSSEGTELLVRHLASGEQQLITRVSEYLWSKEGNILLLEGTSSRSTAGSMNNVAVWRTIERRADTISKGATDYRNFAIDDAGRQVAFTAERDSSAKSLQKFHKLWHWHNGSDSAGMIVERNTPGMPINWTVSENYQPSFSKSGKRLFFGSAPVKAPKDTSLVEIDLVKIDIWHYKDEYLQPQQLRNLDRELRRSYLAVYHTDSRKMFQLADADLPQVMPAGEGDADLFIGVTDKATRIQSQWRGRTFDDVYAVKAADGVRIPVVKGLNGNAMSSPQGRYITWYDAKTRHYHAWADGKTMNISAKVGIPLHNELFDMPDEPNSYGILRWTERDEALLVYDRFDIWQLDPQGRKSPVNITAGAGRRNKTVYRYLQTDPEERFLKAGQPMLLRSFNEVTKASGIARILAGQVRQPETLQSGNSQIGTLLKSEHTDGYVYTKETYVESPDLHYSTDLRSDIRLSRINPQQSTYNWGTAELFRWKAYDGKEATGILYKPEDFDPTKKYPLIAYFYERLSDGLHTYMAPAPTPSRLNIPFFVSRGYLVLAPDIAYRKGYPGRSGFDHVVSGVRAVAKKGWADSTRMGLQGQSWGGYQAAYIITRTNLFKAAWAGAPVANMTSAYGGIRWESGMNRQFQYEHSQSRIGANLWEDPKLYIENSPLFHLPSVKTPLVIMANDADGAVPWYQGIEMFTAMRRLGQKVWMLNYNGEAHNLVERRNRKDIQIREQQFFDWLLKGEKPARWITDGVSATEKGKDWGLGY